MYRKYGIKSVTMDDIARELVISKKTLYQMWPDKDSLVAGVMDLEYEHGYSCVKKLMEKGMNAIDELLEVNRFVSFHLKNYSPAFDYDLKKYYPEIFRKVQIQRRDLMYRNILANMQKGKNEGIYRADLDEEIIARLHVSRMESMHENSMFTIEDFMNGRVFRELFIYHIRGIANEKGIEFLELNMHKLDYNDLNR